MSELTGGCLCGAVRYALPAATVTDAYCCHCARCQRSSGAPMVGWAEVPRAALAVTRGAPTAYEARWFCARCGGLLYRHRDGNPRCAVAVGTLDEPHRVAPRSHRHVAQQLAWLKLGDVLPFSDGGEGSEAIARPVLRGPADPSVSCASPLTLRAITRDNLRAVLLLDVTGPQRRLVATNAVSLAQAYLAGDAWPRAIYADDTPVGFVMAAELLEDELGLPTTGQINLWRFLIDERYQGLGLGRRALALILTELTARWPTASSIWLSCETIAGGPIELYRRFGFQDSGVRDRDGEVMMRLPLGRP